MASGHPDLAPQIRIYGAFFFYSLAVGGIYPRLGDLQMALAIGEGTLGAALVGMGLGTIVSLTFASPLLDRLGYKKVLAGGIPSIAFLEGAATLSSGPLGLFVTLLAVGLVIGAVEVVINVEADRLEHLMGRRVMNRCHAFWSFGFFSAGVIGASAKQWSVTPTEHLLTILPLVSAAVWMALGRMTAAPGRELATETNAPPKFALPTLGTLSLVGFTLSAMLLEGAGADWSVILMRNTFDASPFVDGLAFAIGALAQGFARFFADHWLTRWGTRKVASGLVVVLGAGGSIVSVAPSPLIALLGFAMMGLGTSAMFPLAVSAAAQRTDRPAAVNVAALAQLAFVAFLVGPPLLGFVAEQYGVQMSFALCLPLVVMSGVFVKVLK